MNGIRGNLNDTAAGLAAAEGDMFYATAENTIAGLALPAEGAVMRGRPSAPAWEAVVEGIQDPEMGSNDSRVANWGVYRQTYVGA